MSSDYIVYLTEDDIIERSQNKNISDIEWEDLRYDAHKQYIKSNVVVVRNTKSNKMKVIKDRYNQWEFLNNY